MPNSFWGKPKTTKQQQRIIEKGHLHQEALDGIGCFSNQVSNKVSRDHANAQLFLCWLHRVFIKRREGYWWKAEGGRKNGNFPEAMASRAIRRSVSNWESCSAALLCLPHVTPQHNNTQHTASLHQAGMMSLTPMLTQIEIEIQNQLDVDLENRCVVFRVQKETQQINSKFSLWSKIEIHLHVEMEARVLCFRCDMKWKIQQINLKFYIYIDGAHTHKMSYQSLSASRHLSNAWIDIYTFIFCLLNNCLVWYCAQSRRFTPISKWNFLIEPAFPAKAPSEWTPEGFGTMQQTLKTQIERDSAGKHIKRADDCKQSWIIHAINKYRHMSSLYAWCRLQSGEDFAVTCCGCCQVVSSGRTFGCAKNMQRRSAAQQRSEAWWSLNVYYIIILIIGEMMWNNASSDKLCFWLLLASLALSTVLGIGKPLQCFVFVSSFGTEGFPFDLRNVPAPVKVCSALLGASKETSVKERWWITVSPSLQFCDQSTELRNGSLDGRAYELEIIS